MENLFPCKKNDYVRLTKDFIEDAGYSFKKGEVGKFVDCDDCLARIQMKSNGNTIAVSFNNIEPIA